MMEEVVPLVVVLIISFVDTTKHPCPTLPMTIIKTILVSLILVPFAQAWISIPAAHHRHSFCVSTELSLSRYRPDTNQRNDDANNESTDDGVTGQGSNWLERSFPIPQEKIDAKTVMDYNLGLSGVSFGTGPLSGRMYAAMTKRSSALQQAPREMKDEILGTLRIYAMDFTAKEATKVALNQNGLEMVLQDDEQDEGMWGVVDSIQLLDENDQPIGPMYDDWEDAAKNWTPGQAFDFVVRQVPAKVRELSLEELLQALDPDGSLREEGKAMNMNLIPTTDDLQSLEDMAGENRRRVELSPQDTESVFTGYPEKRGYRVITADALRDCWQQPDRESFLDNPTVLHVMDALVSHGCLVVDLQNTNPLEGLWKTVEEVFASKDTFSPLRTATETGSSYAKVGYIEYDTMAFLETRRTSDGAMLPDELSSEQQQSLQDAFASIWDVSRNVIRIAMAASALEDEANNDDMREDDINFDPFQAADWAVEELVDHGGSRGSVSMSPHRLCRYFSPSIDAESKDDQKYKEVFGAHTDSTFITAVPVATVPGLEVYDEAAERWYRPEALLTSSHCRYVVLVPGEFLQLLTRQEILAGVHRVVVGAEQRFSAPLLLRGRPEAVWNVRRYFGPSALSSNSLLQECDGRTMEEIHASMQNSFQ
jgi:hypothetical protein